MTVPERSDLFHTLWKCLWLIFIWAPVTVAVLLTYSMGHGVAKISGLWKQMVCYDTADANYAVKPKKWLSMDLVWVTALGSTGTAWWQQDLETELLPHCGAIRRGGGNSRTVFVVKIFQAHTKGVDGTIAMNFLPLCVGEVLRAWFVLSVPPSCDALCVCTDLRQPRLTACSAFLLFH